MHMDATLIAPDVIRLQTMNKKQVQAIADNPPHIKDSFLWIFNALELVHMHAQECMLNVFDKTNFSSRRRRIVLEFVVKLTSLGCL